MNTIRKDLLWETLRYTPVIFFALEVVNHRMQYKLKSDLCFFYYFLQELFDLPYDKTMTYDDCKEILWNDMRPANRIIHISEDYGLIVHKPPSASYKIINLQETLNLDKANWAWISYSRVFICGFGEKKKSCSIIDVRLGAVEQHLSPMLVAKENFVVIRDL